MVLGLVRVCGFWDFRRAKTRQTAPGRVGRQCAGGLGFGFANTFCKKGSLERCCLDQCISRVSLTHSTYDNNFIYHKTTNTVKTSALSGTSIPSRTSTRTALHTLPACPGPTRIPNPSCMTSNLNPWLCLQMNLTHSTALCHSSACSSGYAFIPCETSMPS